MIEIDGSLGQPGFDRLIKTFRIHEFIGVTENHD